MTRLQFGICPIVIGVIIGRVTYFQCEGLIFLIFRIPKCVVVQVAVMPTKEMFLIVDSIVAAYVGELVHVFKPTVSNHIPGCCLVNYPVQWDAEVEILGLIFFLVHNDGRNEAFSNWVGYRQVTCTIIALTLQF